MERERRRQVREARQARLQRSGSRRRRGTVAVVAIVLALASCGRGEEGPLPPHSPPRPTTMLPGLELMHAHYHLPSRPVPPSPGMM